MDLLYQNNLLNRLSDCLERARIRGAEAAVMILALDQMAWVKENYGESAGETLLEEVAQRLHSCTRENDLVMLLGTERLLILLNAFNTEKTPLLFAQRFIDTLANPIPLGKLKLSCSGSLGISIFPMDGTTPAQLVLRALEALETARELGSNHFRFFSHEMSERVGKNQRMENALRGALKNGELFLTYQPQLDLHTGRICGVEALLRWRHPQQGDISPDRFLAVAESSGLILPIGEWVLHTACRQARHWQAEGICELRMGVNVSGRQFQMPDFVERVEAILKDTDLPAQSLELEMTESTIMSNIQEAILTLTDLKIRNIHLAIDDFGTGYSSLVYLKHFPFDRIKIAQEFVKGIPDDPDDEAIVEAILMMARSLKLEVIAEGVEKSPQIHFLRERQCKEMQGFYFSPPLTAEQMERCLKQSQGKGPSCLYHH